MSNNWIFSLTFVMLTIGVNAQPILVKDINPGESTSIDTWFSNRPSDAYAGINEIYYFAADDGIHGIELWKSDGTEAGTVMVKDINPGGSAGPTMYHVLNDILYFVANDGTHGEEVWRSDGTEGGTYMLKDVATGNTSSVTGFTRMEVAGDFVFFSLDDGVHGNELWRSDGTEAGTILLKDMVEGGAPSTPDQLYNWNGILYFTNSDSDDDAGREVYRTDGTEAGTYMLNDVYPGSVSSDPNRFTATESLLYFIANDGVHGEELWRTDGTEAGTELVMDINENMYVPFDSHFELYPLGNQLLFVASQNSEAENDLWITDGTIDGTQMLYDYDFPPVGFQTFGDEVYFFGSSNLWKTDGTIEGTMFVDSFSGGFFTDGEVKLIPFLDRLMIVANRYSVGLELWESDGSVGGAEIVMDFTPAPWESSTPGNLAVVDGILFFAATGEEVGKELWAYSRNLEASIEITSPVLCNGDANAALSVTSIGGNSPYSYTWSDSSIEGPNPSGLSAGTYGLTVTDEAGTVFETEIVITEPDPLTITLYALEPENNNQQDGIIWINPNGGTSPLSIEWDIEPTPGNPVEMYNLSAGEYTVTITDANGCQIQETYVVDLVLATSAPSVEWLSKVYPNPVESILQLEIDQQDRMPKRIRIVDAYGNILMDQSFANRIDMSKLPGGSYMLEVIGDNGIQILPIIKI